MARKSLRTARFVLAAATAVGVSASGVALAGASATPNRVVTICINKTTGRLHIAASGACSRVQTAIRLGIGAAGTDGAVGGTGVAGPAGGPQGIQGPQGVQGPAGQTGPGGTQGIAGLQGQQGTQGVVGPNGGIGTAGAVGGTGPAGVAGVAGVAGPGGGTGLTGGTGVPGPSGVAAFNIVDVQVSTGTTVTASCAGKVTSGGGFTFTGLVTVTSSGPAAGGTGWVVNYTTTGAFTVTARAICVTGTETP